MEVEGQEQEEPPEVLVKKPKVANKSAMEKLRKKRRQDGGQGTNSVEESFASFVFESPRSSPRWREENKTAGRRCQEKLRLENEQRQGLLEEQERSKEQWSPEEQRKEKQQRIEEKRLEEQQRLDEPQRLEEQLRLEKQKEEEAKKKKGPNKAILAAMAETLARQKEEEDRLRMKEEAKYRAEEERVAAAIEKKQKDEEKRAVKKEREKVKRAQLKAEGRLFTPAQKLAQV